MNPETFFTADFTKNTEKMAELIDSEFEMLHIPIVPYRDSKPEFCYKNVERKVKTKGGALQYGWFVIESPFTVEATVWEDKNGNLSDISPSRIPLKKALFIPDDRIKYDGEIIDCIRINITNSRLVDDFITLDAIRNIIIAQSPQIQEGQRAIYHPAWIKYKEFHNNVTSFLCKRNSYTSPCYCSSGKSYEFCHGLAFRKSWETHKSQITDVVVRLPINIS